MTTYSAQGDGTLTIRRQAAAPVYLYDQDGSELTQGVVLLDQPGSVGLKNTPPGDGTLTARGDSTYTAQGDETYQARAQ